MKNDCVILKKKEYEDLVAKANGNKPDYVNVRITVVANETIESRFTLDSLTSSLNLGASLKSQILSIRDQLEQRIQRNLDYWGDRIIRKRKHEENTELRLFEQHITNDLEEIIREVPIWSLRKEITRIWSKLVLSKYFES
jgi:hypothetical protein